MNGPKISALIFVSLTFLGGCANAPPEASGAKQVPLSEIMAASTASAVPSGNLDPTITIPKHYVSRRFQDGIPAVVVGAPADVERVLSSGKFGGTAEGVFLISLSMDRAYYPATKKFGGETPDAAAGMEKAGFTNVRIRRRDKEGIPVLTITSEKDGRPNYLAFIAIGNTGSIMRINYVPSVSASSEDARRWETFIGGLAPATRQ